MQDAVRRSAHSPLAVRAARCVCIFMRCGLLTLAPHVTPTFTKNAGIATGSTVWTYGNVEVGRYHVHSELVNSLTTTRC